jgi:hypothetical protein
MPAASDEVNFKNPISRKTTTNPNLEIETPHASSFNRARADRYEVEMI